MQHKKTTYKVELDPSAPTTAFLEQLASLTGVLTSRQKVLIPGGRVKLDTEWSSYRRASNGMVVRLLGEPSIDPMEQEGFFADLPDEILLAIFVYLDVGSLATVRAVCKRFEAVASDAFLWRPICRDRGLSSTSFCDQRIITDRSLRRFHKMYVHSARLASSWAGGDVENTMLEYDGSGGTITHIVLTPRLVVGSVIRSGTASASSAAGVARIWSVETGSHMADLPVTSTRMTHFDVTGSLLAASARDGIRMWDLASLSCVHHLVPEHTVGSVALSPDAASLAASVADDAGGLAIFDVSSGTRMRTLWATPGVTAVNSTGLTDQILDLRAIRGKTISDAEDDAGGAADPAIPVLHPTWVTPFLVGGMSCTSGSHPPMVSLWDTRVGAPVRIHPCSHEPRFFDINGMYSAVASQDGRVTLHDMRMSGLDVSPASHFSLGSLCSAEGLNFMTCFGMKCTGTRVILGASSTLPSPIYTPINSVVMTSLDGSPIAFLDDGPALDIASHRLGHSPNLYANISGLTAPLAVTEDLVVSSIVTSRLTIWSAGFRPF